MIIKYWHGAQIAKQATQKRYIPETPQSCINRRIRTARELIAGYFENEAALLLTDIRKAMSEKPVSDLPEFQALAQIHIDQLWMNCAKEYASLCTFTYLDSIQGKVPAVTEKSADSRSTESAFVKGFCDMAQKAITDYYEQKVRFAETVLALIAKAGDDFGALKEQIITTFKKGSNWLGDIAYEVRIQSTLEWLSLLGCSEYTYICGGSDNTCETCLSLDGQHFHIDNAVAGVNLPPMHPNCRCTIEAFPESPKINIVTILSNAVMDALEAQLHPVLEAAEILIEPTTDKLFFRWALFVIWAVKLYCGFFSTYSIDGTEYQIKRHSFEGVSYLPDGTFIQPENLKPLDEKMLELMKIRDSLEQGSSERDKVEQEIEDLVKENKEYKEKHGEKILSVSCNKPYSFYAFGGDITDQLNTYMRNTETKYAYMHQRTWAENLIEFAKLVGNKREMDLKNQPEWQHSAYVFNGEIVDQDTLGNINYGYFGRHCNIPSIVLIAGAGVAQLFAGSSEIGFWFTLFDDPRDNDRVTQGIEIYEANH